MHATGTQIVLADPEQQGADLLCMHCCCIISCMAAFVSCLNWKLVGEMQTVQTVAPKSFITSVSSLLA